MKVRVFSIIIILFVTLGAVGCSGESEHAADDASGVVQNGSASGDAQNDDPADDASGNAQNDDPEDDPADDAANNADEDYEVGVLLQDLNGNLIALSDFRGEIVVLNFWASWCPPCRQEMPDLEELDKEFKANGDAVFISVNLADGARETKETAEQYMKENGFGFAVLIDDQGLLAYEYNISSIPQTFVLDRDGNISGHIIGSTTKSAILEKVNAAR